MRYVFMCIFLVLMIGSLIRMCSSTNDWASERLWSIAASISATMLIVLHAL